MHVPWTCAILMGSVWAHHKSIIDDGLYDFPMCIPMTPNLLHYDLMRSLRSLSERKNFIVCSSDLTLTAAERSASMKQKASWKTSTFLMMKFMSWWNSMIRMETDSFSTRNSSTFGMLVGAMLLKSDPWPVRNYCIHPSFQIFSIYIFSLLLLLSELNFNRAFFYISFNFRKNVEWRGFCHWLISGTRLIFAHA